MKIEVKMICSPLSTGFITFILFILKFQLTKTDLIDDQLDYANDSLLPPYNENQVFEWKPSGKRSIFEICSFV